MSHHLTSLRRLAFLLVLFGMALGTEYHPRAQVDPDRVSVNLIQEPNWRREVWPADERSGASVRHREHQVLILHRDSYHDASAGLRELDQIW